MRCPIPGCAWPSLPCPWHRPDNDKLDLARLVSTERQRKKAAITASARQADKKKGKHSRTDGTEGSWENDYLAALAEIVFAELVLDFPSDFMPHQGLAKLPDVETERHAFHVEQTVWTNPGLWVRQRIKAAMHRSKQNVFVLLHGTDDCMSLIGGLTRERALDMIAQRRFTKHGTDPRFGERWLIPGHALDAWPCGLTPPL